MYNDIANIGFNISFGIGVILFIVYCSCLIYNYAIGKDIEFASDIDDWKDVLDPRNNTCVMTTIFFPAITFFVLSLLSFAWIISISALVLFIFAHAIRRRKLQKKKMWDTLKNS